MSFPSCFVLAAIFIVPACGDDGDHGGDGGPAAPSGLSATPLAGGAHLTWTDNSDNETEVMVMRKQEGVDTALQLVATLPFDSEQYHDAPLTSGATYRYLVMAMNDAGASESSELTFLAP